jgi:polyphosphate kinase
MVRIAALKRARRSGAMGDPSGLSPDIQLRIAGEKIRDIIRRQYRCLEDEIFPALARGGLELLRPDTYTLNQMDYLETFFIREIYPILSPLRFVPEDGGKGTFPALNKSIYAAFLLSPDEEVEPAMFLSTGSTGGSTGGTTGGRAKHSGASSRTKEPPEAQIAIVQIPPARNRIIYLPDEGGGKLRWALADDLLLTWGAYLFPGYAVKESMIFKVNRDADFPVDEQRDEDFIEAMEEVLQERDHSAVVRMVYTSGSSRLRDTLASKLDLGEDDLYEVHSPLDLGSLGDLCSARGFDSLRLKPRKTYWNAAFSQEEPLWERICQRDVMLHLPYDSFDPVIRFFQDAASDPQVISIKAALYRTSGNSPIIRALEEAALNGKQVTAVVELKARFDEERNISWANRLEKAGVIVVYGLARLKVHAKISLVLRREQDGMRRYVHLSTGNYNDKTAKLYEDICLFTVREDIAFDAGLIFNMLTGYSAILGMRTLTIAPVGLKRRFIELIDREAKRSSLESPGQIIAKMNSLADTDVIEALYRASQAGVSVLLNVRGICTLAPGVPGLSENIRVISVIDTYLEHGRIFYFANAGAEEFYLSSADWMPRNLERRVELLFPVLQEDHREKLRDILDAYFRDNCQARFLEKDGSWTRLSPPEGEAPFRVQEYLLSRAREGAERSWASREEFIVRRR